MSLDSLYELLLCSKYEHSVCYLLPVTYWETSLIFTASQWNIRVPQSYSFQRLGNWALERLCNWAKFTLGIFMHMCTHVHTYISFKTCLISHLILLIVMVDWFPLGYSVLFDEKWWISMFNILDIQFCHYPYKWDEDCSSSNLLWGTSQKTHKEKREE